MRYVVLFLLAFLVSVQAEELPVPVDPSELDGTALKLPIGTIDAPGPSYTWMTIDGSYLAVSDENENGLVLVYLPISGKANADSLKAMLQAQMLPELVEKPEEAGLTVTKSNKELFGSVFRFEFKDTDESRGVGYLALAKHHTFYIMSLGPNPEQVLEKARTSFRAGPGVQFDKPASTKSLKQVTSNIPSHRLKDGVLTVQAGRLKRPAADWNWSQVKEGGYIVYVCTPGEGQAKFIMVICTRASRQIPFEEIIRTTLAKAAPSGEIKVDFSPDNLGLPGNSQKVDFSLDLSGSNILKGVGYLTATDQYNLAVWGMGADDLEPEVVAVVKSFEEDYRDPLSSLGAAVLLLGLLFLGCCGLVNMIAKRPLINGGKIAVVLTILAGIMPFWMAIKDGHPELLGRVVGTLLIPFLVFSFSWSRFNVKKAKWISDNNN